MMVGVFVSKLNNVVRASAHGGFLLFLGTTFSTIIMGINTILVARLLDPKDYGLYTIILVVPSLFINISDIGITSALTRFSALLHASGKDRKLVNFIKAGIIFKLTFSLILSFFLIIASERIAIHVLNRPGIASLICISAPYIIGQAVLNSTSSTFIGLDEAEKSSLLMSFQAMLNVVTSPILILLGFGITGAIIGKSVGVILAAAVGTVILLFRTCPKLEKHSMESESVAFSQGLRTMISFGIPLYLSTIIGSLGVQIKQILLTRFTSNISIGNYKTAMNFSVLINIIGSPISTILFPAFSKLNIKKDRNAIDKMFKISVKYTSLIIIPASIASAILAKNIIYTLYGPDYQNAPRFLALYMLRFISTCLGMFVVGALFNGQGDTRTTFRINIIWTIISLLLASIMIPMYSVPGLIAATFISQLILSIYGLYLINKMYRIKIEWSSSLKILAASLLSALPLYILPKLFPISNSIYILIFAGTLYIISFLILAPLLGAIKEEDLKNLEDITRGIPFLYHFTRYIFKIEEKILKFVRACEKIV